LSLKDNLGKATKPTLSKGHNKRLKNQ